MGVGFFPGCKNMHPFVNAATVFLQQDIGTDKLLGHSHTPHDMSTSQHDMSIFQGIEPNASSSSSYSSPSSSSRSTFSSMK